MDLVKRVYETIVGHGMIAPGDVVLLGVSGGPDSVALLDVLNELQDSFDCTLAVAHFDHGIRGEEGRGDAIFTQELAASFKIPCHIGRAQGDGLPAGGGGNVEARAREARYRFFESVAIRLGMKKIAVGHTQDDQVETMLMWLLRGCGPSGFGGMRAVRSVQGADAEEFPQALIRPLLDVPRADILQYLARRGLRFREDSTNADTRYMRNWIRADLLPELVKRTDDRLKFRLGRLSSLLQNDELLLDQVASRASRDVVRDGVLSRDAFLRLDSSLRLRVLRTWLRSHLGGLRGIVFRHVNAVAQLIVTERPAGRVSLPRGWTVVKDYDSVRLIEGSLNLRAHSYLYELPVEGELLIPEVGTTIKSWRSNRAEAMHPENPFQAIFDWAVVAGTPRLRNRCPGDRFQPLGMAGHKKVKDLFIQQRVARPLRARIPLLLVDDEIFWIPGYGRSSHAQVRAGTREVWNIVMSPIDLGRG